MVELKGWDIKPIKEIAPLQRGFDLPSKGIIKGKYPVIFSNGIGAYHNTFMAKGPGLVTGRSGTIGSLTFIEGDYWPHNTTLWVTDFNGNNPKYVYFLYQTLNWQLYKSGSGVPTLNRNDVHDTKLLIPTDSKEQIAIAEALSDTDNLIASLEKLIAKKKAIKQGAMQELFTGKKRLPGFNGEWVESPCAELGAFFKGKGISMQDTCEIGNPCIMYGDIYVKFDTHFKHTDYFIGNETARNSTLAKKGDLFFTASGETVEEIGKCVSYQGSNSIYIGGDIIAMTPNDDVDSLFLAYAQNSGYLLKQKATMAQGHTVVHIGLEQVKRLMVKLPPSLKEQSAIASLLFDMDAEIEQLEKKLAKYRLIKEGMMQELLTGRIRLIETDKKAETAPKGHNQQYDDALAISAIVNAFYDDRFILGRVKVQKLLYLLRRKQDADVSAFKKKAAGPYNEKARYKGGESIAIKSGYITVERNDKGSKFSKGKKIDIALKYVGNMQPEIDWLFEKFGFYNINKDTKNLEVLATVDMAVCELEKDGKAVNLDTVKEVIRSNKEWAPKLQKPYFTDTAISQAIHESKELFD
ncbi:MAG TPA: restriction endonuclease subunit S [Clostridiales bacterium]|nr:restriction endonuclease subunit S [Clostridiales bacterium]